MLVKSYPSAADFLKETQAALETDEPANSLMLGLCFRLVQHPERFEAAPCLKTVMDDQGLILAALMTPPYNLILYAHREPASEALKVLAKDLVKTGWSLSGLLAKRALAGRFVQIWQETAGWQGTIRRRQRLHALRTVKTPPPKHGHLRVATARDTKLVESWTYGFQQETLGEVNHARIREMVESRIQAGDIFFWEVAGEPVSIAMKNRPAGQGICISLVYTPPGLRRRGFATDCVGALSRELLNSGYDYCTLFTDLANPTSNHIYRVIGYEQIADLDEYRMETPPGI